MGDEEQTPEPVAPPPTLGTPEYYSAKFLENLKKQTATPFLDAKAKAQAAAIENYGDYADLTKIIDESTAAVLNELAKKMAEAMGISLDGVTAASYLKAGNTDPGFSGLSNTPKKIIHRQTRLFEDEQPRENWCYHIAINIRAAGLDDKGQPIDKWSGWQPLSMHKGIHRSKVRALKVLNALLAGQGGGRKIYADPTYFQWRVEPLYQGQTWRERIQQKANSRARGKALKRAARHQQLKNEIEMLHAEKEAKAGRANVIHKVNGGLTNGYEIVPSHTGSPADVEYVPLDPVAPLDPWEEKQAGLKLKEYEAMKSYAKDDVVLTAGLGLYGVQKKITISPEAHAALLAAKHSDPYIGDCPFPV